eukprot:3526124-Amphidinium_carterae.2
MANFNATVAPPKGPVARVVECILQSLRSARIQRFLLWKDSQLSIESLVQTATFQLDKESACTSAPRGSHASVEDLRGQVKAMTAELSSHLGGLDTEICSLIRTWLEQR